MASRQLTDKDLTCITCGDVFVFTAGEQELFVLRGVNREPKRCPACNRQRFPSLGTETL